MTLCAAGGGGGAERTDGVVCDLLVGGREKGGRQRAQAKATPLLSF